MTEDTISLTEAKLMSHEPVCAERYTAISTSLQAAGTRMTKIEYLLYGVMLCVLLGPGTAAEFVKRLIGA